MLEKEMITKIGVLGVILLAWLIARTIKRKLWQTK